MHNLLFSERIHQLNLYEEISVMSIRVTSTHCHLQKTYSIVLSKNSSTFKLSVHTLSKYLLCAYHLHFVWSQRNTQTIFTILTFCWFYLLSYSFLYWNYIQKNFNERLIWWLSSALSSFLDFNCCYHLDSVILSESDRW